MSDQATDIAGAAIRSIRSRPYVIVRVDEMRPVPHDVVALARALHLAPEKVLHCLLSYQANAHAVPVLYREEVAPTDDDSVPDLALARRKLRRRAFVPSASYQLGFTWTPAYYSWNVEFGNGRPLVFPRSPGFSEVMRKATEDRRREARIRSAQPTFETLRASVRDLWTKQDSLHVYIRWLHGRMQDAAKEVQFLETLDGLVGILLVEPRTSIDAGDRRAMEALRAKLDTLLDQARQAMVLDPPDPQGYLPKVAQAAKATLAVIESERFVAEIRTLVENHDVAPPDLWDRTIEVLRLSFTGLLMSPEADRVLDDHVQRLLMLLASFEFDLEGLRAPKLPAFENAVRNAPPAPAPRGVLEIIASMLSPLQLAVGNSPGPASLSVAVLEVAAPMLMTRVISNIERSSRFSGMLYRALVNTAGLGGSGGQPARVALIEAINDGDLGKLRRVDWSRRFLNRGAWSGAFAIAGVICFAAAIQQDDANTLRRWSDIVGSGSGAVLGIAGCLKGYSNLVRLRIIRGIGGRAIGIVGGVAAAVSGSLAAVEEYQLGDRTGMWLAIGGATGGALSVAGFLIALGAAKTLTGVGAPLGFVVMGVGAAIGIATGVAQAVRVWLTAGSKVVFRAFVEHFGRREGVYHTHWSTSRSRLKQAFEAVQREHHDVRFWDVQLARAPELFDVGLPVEHIALIVNEKEDRVRHRLQAEGRSITTT